MRKFAAMSVVIVVLLLIVGIMALFIARAPRSTQRVPRNTQTAEPDFTLPDNPIVFTVANNAGNTLGFIDPDGSNFTTREVNINQLSGTGYHLRGQKSWSPDGSFLVMNLFDVWDYYYNIPTIITEDGKVYSCAEERSHYGHSLPLDSAHVFTTTQTSVPGPTQIVTLNIESCQIESVVYTDLDGIGNFAISTDGWIAYESSVLVLIILDDQHREVFRIEEGENPDWSNDGEWLAYTKFDDGVYIVRRNGTETQHITNDGYTPSWSPDGERLVYGTTHNIAILDIATGQSVLIYSGGHYPDWR
jgi:hypothetical protein